MKRNTSFKKGKSDQHVQIFKLRHQNVVYEEIKSKSPLETQEKISLYFIFILAVLTFLTGHDYFKIHMFCCISLHFKIKSYFYLLVLGKFKLISSV